MGTAAGSLLSWAPKRPRGAVSARVAPVGGPGVCVCVCLYVSVTVCVLLGLTTGSTKDLTGSHY